MRLASASKCSLGALTRVRQSDLALHVELKLGCSSTLQHHQKNRPSVSQPLANFLRSVAPASAPHLRLGCSCPPVGGAVASEAQYEYEEPMAEPVQVVLQGVVVEGEVMGVVDKEY